MTGDPAQGDATGRGPKKDGPGVRAPSRSPLPAGVRLAPPFGRRGGAAQRPNPVGLGLASEGISAYVRTLFLSSVTAPLIARALPCICAPVFMVIDADARTFP